MKKIKNNFEWYRQPYWHWPDSDEKLLQVNDWVNDAELIMSHVKKRTICVQAGGACGVWPAYFATQFKSVITFEPHFVNYDCLLKNTSFLPNVSQLKCALSDTYEEKYLTLDDCEKGNSGAYYLREKKKENSLKVRTTTIDTLGLPVHKVGLIQLDVEGYEYQALRGAHETIEHSKPTIVIEEKQLPHMHRNAHLKARKYLELMGYEEVARIHKDVIFRFR